jgi:transcriptional regulator with XRE-family HTH domain
MMRLFRSEAGLSRREVARRAGFSADTARRCEHDLGRVRIDKFYRYAAACGVEITLRIVPRNAS